jgi:DNA recombination protein RmuC
MDLTILFAFLLGIVGAIAAVFVFRKSLMPKSDEMNSAVAQSVELKIREILPDVMKTANEQLVVMADQKLGAEKKEIRTDLENKREEIERLIKVIQVDLKDSKEGLDKAEKERIGSFMALKSQLEEYKKVTDQLSVSTENLKKVLSNNQLRGQFGEQVAEDLLRMSGFVKGTDYQYNQAQESADGGRPDFTIFLPDGTKINVDSKFPYANLQKLTEAENQAQRDEFKKAFERDVKEKIKQVTGRNYINPDDKTVDFVILFIPNEMIFSYIYDKMNDIWSDAMTRKVVFAGPFSFTAILRLVKQAYDNFKYQKNIREIVGHVKAFEKEFGTFYEEFQKFGDKIESLQKQYNIVSTTRTNQLVKRVERIQLSEGDTEGLEAQQKLLD